MIETVKGWRAARRIDGIEVRKDVSGSWVIVGGGQRLGVDLCPCCDEPFSSAISAMRAANALFPLPTNPPALRTDVY
jgi:hypothetical protein